jgi:beta-glucanase (GH16 family)
LSSAHIRGNNEAEWYLGENAQVSSGTLKITAKKESYQSSDYTSARIRTFDKVGIDLTQDTLVQARIKVPSGGQGLWPAFWLLPSPEVTWPHGGEIDILEFIGREPFYCQGYMHYGTVYGDKSQRGGPMRLPEPVFEAFHIFSIIKTKDKISWIVDGYEYQSYTSSDIEPKYNWPFERTYYVILNLAVGGDWPGDPDGSTIFPSTMEVDYVRAYSMSGGKTIPLINGTRLVHQDAKGVEYCVFNAGGSSITWEVPGDATFTTSSNSDCIFVDFATASGYVKAFLPSNCTTEGNYNLSIPVEVQPFYGVVLTILNSTMQPTLATGNVSVVNVDYVPALEYTRNISELYDNILIDIPLVNLSDYLTGNRKFFLDIKTTTSAPCTQVMIQLEDSTMALPDNYGVGRHSRYQCFLEPTRQWQRVACDFYDRPDSSVTSVDRVVVLLDPTLVRNDVYYIGSIDVGLAGCTSNCEALQSNGASTDNCRKAAKSEAGACNDGINNDYYGYNGNQVTDCADPQCFDIDPVCRGPNAPSTSTIPVPIAPSPASPIEFNGPAQCSANPACSALAGDCCPTANGVFLGKYLVRAVRDFNSYFNSCATFSDDGLSIL